MNAPKHALRAKSFQRKKGQISSAAKEFYSGFAENVRESYISRFAITEKECKETKEKTKTDK
jgi:hypothetical protein